jgi:PncC family amidohydrolase
MVAGSSAVFAGGVIAYSNPVKHDLLGVPTALLQTQGAVSAEVVEAMARGVQRLMKVHCALSVSGIAGPGGGSEHKPVGLVYIGMALGDELLSFEHHFGGDRQAVREQTALVAMGHVRDALQKI